MRTESGSKRTSICRGWKRLEENITFTSIPIDYLCAEITHGLELNAPGFALSVDIEDFCCIGTSQKLYTVPHLREATPFEDLARWVLFNRTFGDSVKIEGVIGTQARKQWLSTSRLF